MKRFPILIVLFLWLGFVGVAKDLSIPQTAPTGHSRLKQAVWDPTFRPHRMSSNACSSLPN